MQVFSRPSVPSRRSDRFRHEIAMEQISKKRCRGAFYRPFSTLGAAVPHFPDPQFFSNPNAVHSTVGGSFKRDTSSGSAILVSRTEISDRAVHSGREGK